MFGRMFGRMTGLVVGRILDRILDRIMGRIMGRIMVRIIGRNATDRSSHVVRSERSSHQIVFSLREVFSQRAGRADSRVGRRPTVGHRDAR